MTTRRLPEHTPRHQSAAALASIALGAGMAINALLGPLGLRVIQFRESANMENQLLGGELVCLVLAAPLAIIAGLLWWRHHRIAPPLGAAAAGFALYTYPQYVLVPDYARYNGNNEQFFPWYVLLILLGWVLFAYWCVTIAQQRSATLARRTQKIAGTLMIGTNALFAFAWTRSIGNVLSGVSTLEYAEHPTAFWLIRMMDLAFVIPVGIAVGVALLRNAPWASRAALAVFGTETLLVSAVAAMAIRMTYVDDPAASMPMLLIAGVSAMLFLSVYSVLLQESARAR